MNKVEQAFRKTIAKFGHNKPFTREDVERIFRAEKIALHIIDLPKPIYGYIAKYRNRRYVLINEKIKDEKEFLYTAFHEMGHYFLKHASLTEAMFLSAEYNYREDIREIEANQFANLMVNYGGEK